MVLVALGETFTLFLLLLVVLVEGRASLKLKLVATPASPLSAEVIVMSPCTGQSPAYCVLSKPFAPVLVVFTDEEFEALGEIKA